MNKISVFCGSSPGARSEYVETAKQLGLALVERNIGLVYGGASVGIMGKLAETVIAAGGEVIGVIPVALVDKEVAFEGLPDLRVVNSMHERKAMMADLSDGFVALPGGLGTIEEFLEAITWAQLGMHTKPCGVLNVCDYFRSLMDFLDRAVAEKFIRAEHRSMVLLDEDPNALLDQFEHYVPPKVDKAKWILSLNET